MELQLVVVAEPNGEPQAFHFPDFDRVTLGRGPDSPVPLDGNALSREHVRFELSAGALAVTDISSNGTWVNGKALGAGLPRELKSGDEVSVAGYRIRPRLTGTDREESSADETVSDAAPPTKPPSSPTASTEIPTTGSPPEPPETQPPPPPAFRLSSLEAIVLALALAVVGLVVLFFVY